MTESKELIERARAEAMGALDMPEDGTAVCDFMNGCTCGLIDEQREAEAAISKAEKED